MQFPLWAHKLRTPSRYKISYGGRGGGKSRNKAGELIRRSTELPLRILCCREIQRSINDSVKRLLDDRINEYVYSGLIPSGFFRSTRNEVTTAIGGNIIFAGLKVNPETIKSMEGIDICWNEEAQTTSRESLDLLIPTIRTGRTLKRSELWFSMNPRYADDPVYADFIDTDDPRPGTMLLPVSWQDNPWFPEVLETEREYDKTKSLDRYNHIWEGKLIENVESKVFAPHIDWDIGDVPYPPEGVLRRYGSDWGEGKTDPTTLVRVWVDEPNRIIYVDREFYKLECPIEKIGINFLKTMGSDMRCLIRADSARPGLIKYVKSQKVNIVGAKKGPGSIDDGIEFMKTYKIIVSPSCTHTIDEFESYSYKVDKRTGEILPEYEDSNNHIIDPIRYALEPLMLASYSRVTILRDKQNA